MTAARDARTGRGGPAGGAGAPATQRAIVQSGYGDADAVLSLSTAHPVLAPSPTQVQIRVHAASLNPIDWQMVQGNRRLISRRSFPFVPLFDIAGVVTAVGSAVTRFAVGDAVYTDNEKDGGGASEFVNVDQDLVSAKPGSLSFAEAAAVPLAAQTALMTLETAGVGEGSRVVVIGASGGVGSFAVQMAKALGARHVVGVCSGRNSDVVKALGADEIVDHTRTTMDEALRDRPMDVVIDCVGGRAQWVAARRILVPGGRFVTISRDEDGEVTVAAVVRMVTTITARRIQSRWGRRVAYVPVFLHASSALLDRVGDLITAGQVRVLLGERCEFTLPGVLGLIKASKGGRMVGKSVVEVISEGPRP